MPYIEKLLEKKYFSISEVSKQLGVSSPLIRFWEKELKLDSPSVKGSALKRKYLIKHIETLKTVKKLIREDKYSLKGVKSILEKRKKYPLPEDLLDSMRDVRKFLSSMKNFFPN